MDNRKTVLLCEDDPVQLKVMVAAFEKAGYATLGSPSPAQALQDVRSRRPDAVVTDVQLKEGNGFDLVDRLRKANVEVPVIMVSAAGTEATRERARALGVLNFLEKPFDLDRLVGRVGEIVRLQRGRNIGGRVLIVDDDPVSRMLLSETLFQAGVDVIVAEDGPKALQLLRSADPPIDMALADFHLPGMSGPALISEICRSAPGIFVVMVTGEALQEEIREGFKAGATALIRKPFSPKEVVAFVERNMDGAHEMRERARGQEAAGRAPLAVRARKWVGSYLHARAGSAKHKRLVAAKLGAVALILGLGIAIGMDQALSTVDHYKREAEDLMRKLEMEKELHRRQVEVQRAAPAASPR